jgi:hypothetical protein
LLIAGVRALFGAVAWHGFATVLTTQTSYKVVMPEERHS